MFVFILLLLCTPHVLGSCTPNPEAGDPLKVGAVYLGLYYSCVNLDNGKSKCWGRNDIGSLGLGDWDHRGDEPDEMGANLPYTLWSGPIQYMTGNVGRDTYALLEDGTVEGVGLNTDGHLCQGDDEARNTPVQIDLGSIVVKALYPGYDYACVLSEDDQYYCWGDNGDGVLGVGNMVNVGDAPDQCGDNLVAVDLGASAPEVKTWVPGPNHQCVIFVDDSVKCWGQGIHYKLGYGNTNDMGVSAATLGDNLPFVDLGDYVPKELHLGTQHTCMWTTTDEVVCWGKASEGEIGIVTSEEYFGDSLSEMGNALEPIDFGSHNGSPRYPTDMKCGKYHCCAILNDHNVVCWGRCLHLSCGTDEEDIGNEADEVGDNFQPVDFSSLGGRYPVELFSGYYHNCVILDDGALACWGSGYGGDLGQGNSDNSAIPVLVDIDGTLSQACIAGFHLGGTASLEGATVDISIDQDPAQTLSLSADGAWQFPEKVVENAVYAVSLGSIASHSCSLEGTIQGTMTAEVSDVSVTCALNSYSFGGSAVLNEASGVTVDLMISSAVAQTATLNSDDSWSFSSPVNHGEAYEVVVSSPTGYLCTVSGSTTDTMTAEVNDISVLCRLTYALGGSASLNGATGVEVSVNQPENTAQTETLDSDGAWTFGTDLFSGETFAVTVVSPPDYSCTVTGTTSSTIASDISDLAVECLPTYSVGGTATLNGATGVEMGVMMQIKMLNADGAYTFSTELVSGDTYQVTVGWIPNFECTLSGSTSGTIAADVTDVDLVCLPTFSLGGSSTLNGATGVEVSVNQPSDTPQTATLNVDGSWTFANELASGDTYVVSLSSQPLSHTCTLGGSSDVAITADTTDLTVTCTVNTYELGGSTTNLNGATPEVRVEYSFSNTVQTKTLASDGVWTFDNELTHEDAYTVTVTSPTGFDCSLIGSASSTITADTDDIVVECLPTFVLGGSATLNGATPQVSVEYGPSNTVQTKALSSSAWTFDDELTQGHAYAVTVTSPTDYVCTLVGSTTGTVAAADINDLVIECLSTYALGGSASLNGATGVEVSVNQPDDTAQTATLSLDGAWTFGKELVSGDTYTVSIVSIPIDYDCTLSGTTSDTISADVSDVSVTCLPFHSLGGTAVLNGATVELSQDQSQSLTVSQDGAFTFTDKLLHGSSYLITATDPENYECEVDGPTSSTITGPVSDVIVTCTLIGYPVSGTVTLNGASGAMLHIEGEDSFEHFQKIDDDGDFQLDTLVPYGAGYVLSVTSPTGYSCTFSGFNGTVVQDVEGIEVVCEDLSLVNEGTGITGYSEEESSVIVFIIIIVVMALIICACLVAVGYLYSEVEDLKVMTPTAITIEMGRTSTKKLADEQSLNTPGLYKQGFTE